MRERKHYPAATGYPPPAADRSEVPAMSDAAARALAAGPLPDDDAMYAFAEAKARGRSSEEAIEAAYRRMRPGPPGQADPERLPGFIRFVDWLRGGEAKAALVKNAAGETLIPEDLTVEVLREVRRLGVFRRNAGGPAHHPQQAGRRAHRRPVGRLGPPRDRHRRHHGRLPPREPRPRGRGVRPARRGEGGRRPARRLPRGRPGRHRRGDRGRHRRGEDAKFAAGTGSGQPAGLALAANVARVPAGQKVAVAATNTPTAAQLTSIPWKLHTRWRDDAVWLLHPTSAEKVAALTFTNGDAVWPQPGPLGPGLLGWPAYVLDGLPDPATAGTGDASIWFINLRAAYRVVARSEITVTRIAQRCAVEGLVAFTVKVRVGGDLVRPAAAAIYTQ